MTPYIIVSADAPNYRPSLTVLAERVNEMIEMGYKPIGSVFPASRGYAQAMVLINIESVAEARVKEEEARIQALEEARMEVLNGVPNKISIGDFDLKQTTHFVWGNHPKNVAKAATTAKDIVEAYNNSTNSLAKLIFMRRNVLRSGGQTQAIAKLFGLEYQHVAMTYKTIMHAVRQTVRERAGA